VTNARVWLQDVFTVCYLDTQYRQIDDDAYTAILNGIREGVLTRRQLALLQERTAAAYDPFLPRTRLLTVNVDVDEVNNQQLDELPGKVHEYTQETHGSKQYVEQLQRSCLAPALLRLKVGAQVMCIKNAQDRKYVNGSLGKVVGFEKPTDYPVVELNDGREVTIRPETWELVDGDKHRASIMQLPLRLAWAITVHKSQGMTLDAARIDLSRAFVEGMGYVALSRVRGLRYLVLDGFNAMALRVSPLAKQINAELRRRSDEALASHAAYLETWRGAEARGEHEKPLVTADVVTPDPVLFESLRTWRAKLASEQHLPPYIIAHDKTLQAVAALKPQNPDELASVPGFGTMKIARFGQDIYALVQQHLKAGTAGEAGENE